VYSEKHNNVVQLSLEQAIDDAKAGMEVLTDFVRLAEAEMRRWKTACEVCRF